MVHEARRFSYGLRQNEEGLAAGLIDAVVTVLEENDLMKPTVPIGISLESEVGPGGETLTLQQIREAVCTVGEAAGLMGVDKSYVKKQIYRGKLPAIRLGNEWILDRSVVTGWERERKPGGK